MMPENALFEFDRDFNTYLGYIFEDICREVARKEFRFQKMGIQLGTVPKEMREQTGETSFDIDIIAVNEEKEILLGECKWSEKVDAQRIAKKLEERAGYVEWKNKERKEIYAIFARSFYRKIEEWNGKRVYCFDLDQIEKILKEDRD
jgi:hypothetical protein